MANKLGRAHRRWRDKFGEGEVIQRVRPEETDAWLPNPHRGTTTFQRFQGDPVAPGPQSPRDTFGPTTFEPAPKKTKKNRNFIPFTTLSYCRWPWRWLEPRKGKFNWKLVDAALKAARDRGQTLQVRFQPFTEEKVEPTEKIASKRRPPATSVDVPDWYWDTGARWIAGGKRKGCYEPDHNDPLWVKHFGAFIRAFGERYDGHPDLESIDLAYAGHWGESGGNSNAATAAKLINLYLKSFKKTQLLSMLGTHGCKYAATKGRAVGWRADCFGDMRKRGMGVVPDHLCWTHMYDAYPREILRNGVQDAWKTSPITMESCGNVATWFLGEHDLEFIIDQGYKYHMSVFMPKSVRFPDEWMDKLVAFDKKIGYRFVLRQMVLPLEAKPGQRIGVPVFIDNVGCAPIYRPYRAALRFTQGKRSFIVPFKQDIRKWMPGHSWFEETIKLPDKLKPGEAKVALGITDEKDNLKVRFAIKPMDPDGWHTLTNVDVVKP